MDKEFYSLLTTRVFAGDILDRTLARQILTSPQIELLDLLHAAYQIRKEYVGKEVIIHIINNTQNGFCPEDCHYCAQAKSSRADIEEYPLKSDEEILGEAREAFAKGAYRYCMVFAGRGPSLTRVEKLAALICRIKAEYPSLEICVSCGLLNLAKAKILKEAGLDRLNHNLNTSPAHYPHICTTHTFEDRLNTVKAAKAAGIQLCSGIIVGLNETTDDIIELAVILRDLKTESIPVNFLMPIPGNVLSRDPHLTPEFCLRVLCLFRFLNPRAEIRIGAGREYHLRGLEGMALYPANSLFLDGYLNTKGERRLQTLQMIKDYGFTIKSSFDLEELIEKEKGQEVFSTTSHNPLSGIVIKDKDDLRPQLKAAR